MKKVIKEIVLIISIIICIFILTDSYREYNNLLNENKVLYKNANNLNIVDIDGNINLKSKTEEKNVIINEIKEKMKLEQYDEEKINDLIEKTEYNNSKLKQDITILLDTKEELINKRNTLNRQYEILYEQYKLKQETYIINNVPTILQYPDYPTGCESVALTIFLRYYGYNITVDDVIAKLKLGEMPYLKENVWYGGNPELEFIGSPYDDEGYGVYEKPIYDIAYSYNNNVKIGTGKSLSEVLEIVKSGNPVLVWISYNLSLPYISASWLYEPTNEKIYWKSGEHAVVIVGYNTSQVIVSDPSTGTIKYLNKSVFENRYNYFGKKNIYLGS